MFVMQGADNPSRCFLACGDGQRDAAQGEECDDGNTYSLDGCDLVVCVFITEGPSTKLFARGRGGYWRTCATRDDEPRPVWTSLPITHCLCHEQQS